jgi:hypothetical protein
VKAIGNKLVNTLKTCKFHENRVKISWEQIGNIKNPTLRFSLKKKKTWAHWVNAAHIIGSKKFSDLLHFSGSLVIYKEEKDIPLVGPKHTPPNCWKLGLGREKNHELHSLL